MLKIKNKAFCATTVKMHRTGNIIVSDNPALLTGII